MDASARTFEDYLFAVARISTRAHPYYLSWIRKFREMTVDGEKAASDHRNTELEAFRYRLSKQYEPWQVEQACRAVRHYWFWLDRSAAPDVTKGAALDVEQADTALLDETRRLLRLQHKSYRTEKTYLGWIRRFLAFAGTVDRASMDQATLRQFLSYLAVERSVSAATQQQAFNALLFLFRNVLNAPVEEVATSV